MPHIMNFHGCRGIASVTHNPDNANVLSFVVPLAPGFAGIVQAIDITLFDLPPAVTAILLPALQAAVRATPTAIESDPEFAGMRKDLQDIGLPDHPGRQALLEAPSEEPPGNT